MTASARSDSRHCATALARACSKRRESAASVTGSPGVSRIPEYRWWRPRSRARCSIGTASCGVTVATPKRRPSSAASIIEASQMPTTGIETSRLSVSRPGSPKALTMMPDACDASRIPISTTSSAAAARASAVTIIGGPRVAVAPVTARPSGTQDRAISTIIAVVSRDVFGFISKIGFNGTFPTQQPARLWWHPPVTCHRFPGQSGHRWRRFRTSLRSCRTRQPARSCRGRVPIPAA